MRWLRGRRNGGKRRSLELTPDEQVALRFLLDEGEAEAADLRQIVVVQRGATEHQAGEALRRLQAKALMAIDRVRADKAYYRPTDLARKLRDRLPPDARSTMEFYL